MTPGPWYKRLPFIHSRLGRLVVGLNIISLLILVSGTLVVNEFRRGLIDAYEDSLKSQAQTIGNLIGAVATGEEWEAPHLQPYYAAQVMNRFIPQGQRARLFDINGKLVSDGTWIADSYSGSDRIDVAPLPPARKSTDPKPKDNAAEMAKLRAQGQSELQDEVAMALSGTEVAHVRRNERGKKVVSVSIPIKRVKTVLGVLTLERGNVDEIVQAQRQAMVPFILVALGVTFLSSIMLHFLITRPIQRLSLAADTVRANQARAISLPDLEERHDEIGGLARSLESMTDTLWRRMEEIDRFAADVAHEIKNPLTSIRSALETLVIVKDDTAKDRLMGVLNQDVRRLDRLITDISNASRLDAELSRDVPKVVDVAVLLEDIVSLYEHTGDVRVVLSREIAQAKVSGREGPLGQVFRNVIDNARSFSADGGEVRVALAAGEAGQLRVTIEDDGPGIPEENLETIFQRFYTSRPKGTTFGNNSGLGLSISRQIIDAHHGKIWAENRIEGDKVVGAKFSIVLPAA
jgi:two-component system, OmpR family, sensor histidine kinase ChvG